MQNNKTKLLNLLNICLFLFASIFRSSSVFQLSQPGASLDNRVPTPASATSADLHSQHVGADLPAQEVKAESHHDQQEFEAAGGKTEPKMEVGWSCTFRFNFPKEHQYCHTVLETS